ncbi:MAG: sulfatase [Planctomycetaceae bacterium]|nr:sulfatase [Planctomycetaceae bacterium]
MNPILEHQHLVNRRLLLRGAASSIGVAALSSLMPQGAAAETNGPNIGKTHFVPRAKRVVYLFQSGGPSHLELLDPKPKLKDLHGSELPDSIRRGQRLTGMTSGQKSFTVVASKFGFKRCGAAGNWLSELLPHTGRVMDNICMIRSMHTEAINHDPAITLIQTGSQQPGRPSMGAWVSYGLGSEAEDLPAFAVLISHGSGKDANQGLLERLWGAGFLPSSHQGVKLRSSGDPVLYLANPPGIDRNFRRQMLDGLARLNQQQLASSGNPEIAARIAQYEMAFRMQQSVPDLTDLSAESASTFELYGEESKQPGTFAANCLLARRMLERGVRFVQLYHRGWDQHGNLVSNIPKQCRDIDQSQAALITDLKQRGMLDDTLIIWGGEFGRTVYGQGGLKDDYGRDHHGRCYSMWLAGGGIRGGHVHGETDDYGYNIVRDPIHIHDLNATVLHCLGLDHRRLTFRQQGRDYRLTDIHGNVMQSLLS